jgi:hypothetical protein
MLGRQSNLSFKAVSLKTGRKIMIWITIDKSAPSKTPEVEDMHLISGYDETLIAGCEEADAGGPVLKITPEVFEKAIEWAKANESLGYRFVQENSYFGLSFRNPKYPGQKGFVFELIYFNDEFYGPRNNHLKYAISYGVKRLYLNGFLLEEDTLDKILSRELAKGEDLNPKRYKSLTTAPEYATIEPIVNRFLQQLETIPEIEDMHLHGGYGESRLVEETTRS